jgi:hypothetical protein
LPGSFRVLLRGRNRFDPFGQNHNQAATHQ